MARLAQLKKAPKVAHSMTLAQGGIDTDQKLFRLLEAVISDLGADELAEFGEKLEAAAANNREG